MLYLLPSPIGNLSDITLHTLEILQKSEIFLCEDTRNTQKLLLLLEQRALISHRQRTFFAFHSHNQDAFLDTTLKEFFSQDVVFMSDAGMPSVSDPGSALVRYAQKNQIAYEVVLGGSASTLAYAYSGFGDRGFVFDSFLPHKSKERKEKIGFWAEVLQDSHPLVVFESPHRLKESLQDFAVVCPQCQMFIIKEMTKKHTKSFWGTPEQILASLEGQNTQGEWVFVITFVKTQTKRLGVVEILQSDIPPKAKAKLLSKITGESTKQWYERLEGEK